MFDSAFVSVVLFVFEELEFDELEFEDEFEEVLLFVGVFDAVGPPVAGLSDGAAVGVALG